ncbi:MAG TPA: cytochrome P450 [Pseudonocardia sp.]
MNGCPIDHPEEGSDLLTQDVEDLVANFMIFDPRLAADPYPVLDRIREKCPIGYSKQFGGYWVLTKVEHMRHVLTHPELFSSTVPIIPRLPSENMLLNIPVGVDPPDHTAYRRLLGSIFSPTRIKSLEPAIRDYAQRAAHRITAQDGPIDFLHDFAVPLPAAALLSTLGLPETDLELLLRFRDEMTTSQFSPDPGVREHFVNVTFHEISEYFQRGIEARRDRATAADDFFTAIVHSRFRDERPLTDPEIIGIVSLLISAGLDTTAAQLCFFMIFFAAHPQRWQEIIDHPRRIPGAVEELLRLHSSVTPGRLVMADTEIGGVPVKKDEMVCVVLPASAHDEDEFPDALTADFERSPNRHLAFGGGPHLCLGANLARFQLRIALEELTRAMPSFRIASGTAPERVTGILMGVTSLFLEPQS